MARSARREAAYFNKINAEGGINGRKINFISYDDAFSPPKAVEQARKLVESDEVLLIFQPLGTQSNSATQKYMNAKKVPQLFVATGATKWGDPQNFPWTMGWQPNYQSEGRIYAAYILKNYPNGKIAALWQNDDAGKDQMKGLRDGLGDKASMIIADKSYEVSDPTIDSQIVALKDSGADIFMTWAAPKGAAQAIRKVGELGWKPVYLPRQRLDFGGDGAQAGRPRKFQGHHFDGLSEGSDRSDLWKDDPGIKTWLAFMDKYFPDGDKTNNNNVYGYAHGADHGAGAEAMRRQSHARERHEAGRQPEEFPPATCCCPASRSTPAPNDYFPIEQMQLMKFNGESVGTVRRHHHRRGRALRRRMRHHSVVPLLDRHYPGISGSTSRRELGERLLPAEIAGFDRNHRRQVCLLDVDFGSDRKPLSG